MTTTQNPHTMFLEGVAYTIGFNEYQRALLVRVLRAFPASDLAREPGSGAYDTMQEELEVFIQMLGDLPEDERQHPGILHGFCL